MPSFTLLLKPRRTLDGNMVQNVTIIENVSDTLGEYPKFVVGVRNRIKPIWPSNPDLITPGRFQPENAKRPQR
jgi:hypothetical protein